MIKLDTSKIDKILNTFLEDNDFECSAKADTDFAYYYKESLITYSLVVSERMDRLFLAHALRKGLKVDCGIFLLSFFHELGHNETIDEIEDDEYLESQTVKATLSDSDADAERYFNLVDESLATSWAISYINNNIEIVKALALDLQSAIADFYEKYEIRG